VRGIRGRQSLEAKTWEFLRPHLESNVSDDGFQPRGKGGLSIFLDLAETSRLFICGDCITMAQKPEEQHSLFANYTRGRTASQGISASAKKPQSFLYTGTFP
jgi:hypothetical protein